MYCIYCTFSVSVFFLTFQLFHLKVLTSKLCNCRKKTSWRYYRCCQRMTINAMTLSAPEISASRVENKKSTAGPVKPGLLSTSWPSQTQSRWWKQHYFSCAIDNTADCLLPVTKRSSLQAKCCIGIESRAVCCQKVSVYMLRSSIPLQNVCLEAKTVLALLESDWWRDWIAIITTSCLLHFRRHHSLLSRWDTVFAERCSLNVNQRGNGTFLFIFKIHRYRIRKSTFENVF